MTSEKRLALIKPIILAAGALSLAFSVYSLAAFNLNAGSVLVSAAALSILLYGVFLEKLIKIRLLNILIITGLASFLSFSFFLYLYGSSDSVDYSEDAVIVLGAAVKGETVSRVLARRLDRAAEYHKRNGDAMIVVSGGQGFQEDITEALAMERYLIAKGVTADRIVKEDKSSSTYENLAFSKIILDGHFDNEYRTVVITNDFHIYRACWLAKRAGYDVSRLGAASEWQSVPANYLREVLAVMKTWLLKK